MFATRKGKALGQRNALRALYGAQERARTPEGTPTFPELFVHDEHGHLAVDARGAYVPNRTPRRDLPPLPDFHALRHTAAMDCDDAEEARALLRHKNSNVTRVVYRAHFGDREQEALRARLEARAVGASAPVEPPAASPPSGKSCRSGGQRGDGAGPAPATRPARLAGGGDDQSAATAPRKNAGYAGS